VPRTIDTLEMPNTSSSTLLSRLTTGFYVLTSRHAYAYCMYRFTTQEHTLKGGISRSEKLTSVVKVHNAAPSLSSLLAWLPHHLRGPQKKPRRQRTTSSGHGSASTARRSASGVNRSPMSPLQEVELGSWPYLLCISFRLDRLVLVSLSGHGRGCLTGLLRIKKTLCANIRAPKKGGFQEKTKI